MVKRADGLPRPVSVDACYLDAILDELRALRAEMARRVPEPKPELEIVELREPKPEPKAKPRSKATSKVKARPKAKTKAKAKKKG